MSLQSSLQSLQQEISGEVIVPPDTSNFGDHEVFYGEFRKRRPTALVKPASASDVSAVVSYAQDSGTELVVRAGGHSILGHSSIDGGLVLDMSRLNDIEIDVDGGTAWARGGVLAGEYTTAAAQHGLITGFGDTPTVGVAGLTLGGGVGLLHRRLGLTIDSLLGAEIVTADGQIRQIDNENDPDLFWAIRGGGGNFGVVTRLHFRLHPIDTVLGGMLILPATPQLIADFVEGAQEASDDLSVIGAVALAPPMPFLPEHVHGELVVMAIMVHTGESEMAEAEVGKFRKLATPLVDGLQVMPYAAMYEAEGGPPQPEALSGRSVFSDAFGLDQAEAAVGAIHSSTADMSVVQIRVLGGQVARVPSNATAFAHRDRAMIVNVAAAYEDTTRRPDHEAWVDALAGQVQVGPPGAYLNFHADDSEQAVREIYPGETWERLVEVKTKYDQTNLFSANHNIPPRA